MKTVLKQIFDNEIDVHRDFTRSAEYKKCRVKQDEIENIVTSLLNTEKDKEKYENLKSINSKLSSMESEQYFEKGFKLGFRLINDIAEKTEFIENLFKDEMDIGGFMDIKRSSYVKSLHKDSGIDDKLIELLDDEGKKLLKDYTDSIHKNYSIYTVECFKEGLKTGFNLTKEVYCDE